MAQKERPSLQLFTKSARVQPEVATGGSSCRKTDRRCGLSENASSCLKYGSAWVIYLLLGSMAFIYLEQITVTEPTLVDHQHWARFKEFIRTGVTLDQLLELQNNLIFICPHRILNSTINSWATNLKENSSNDSSAVTKLELHDGVMDEVEKACEDSLKILTNITTTSLWSFADSVYFTMTLVTTIGYGHIYPHTRNGRIFSVLFSMVGVPLTCIFLAKFSDQLSNNMLHLYEKARKRYRGQRPLLLYGVMWLYLSVGFIVFMCLPSVALVALEDWTYVDALYYTFITLSTIGFGDMVAGYNEDIPYGDAYKIGIVVWIMISLGYWFLLLSFLQKALRKDVTRRLKKTLQSKTIQRQAEFFRHLVGKVHRGDRKRAGLNVDPSVMELMVEVSAALSREATGGPPRVASRPMSRKASALHEAFLGGGDTCLNDDGKLSLSDLLDVNVIVRNDSHLHQRGAFTRQDSTMAAGDAGGGSRKPSFHMDLGNSCQHLPGGCVHEGLAAPQPEVTLPLRDVLNLVSMVASVAAENEGSVGSPDTSLEEDESTPSSPMNMSFDPREARPLLNELFQAASRSRKNSYNLPPPSCPTAGAARVQRRARLNTQGSSSPVPELEDGVISSGSDGEVSGAEYCPDDALKQ